MECSANVRIRHVKQHRVYRGFSRCRCQRNFSRSLLDNLCADHLEHAFAGHNDDVGTAIGLHDLAPELELFCVCTSTACAMV